MDLEVRGLGRNHREAGQHLTQRARGELEIHQHVVGGGYLDRAAGQPARDDGPHRYGDRAHGLHTVHRAEHSGHLVEPVDAHVEYRTNLRAVEGSRVAGVLVPARRTESGELAHCQGRSANDPRRSHFGQPADAASGGRSWGAEQEQAAGSRRFDQRVRLFHGRRQRLLGEDVAARLKELDRDFRVERARSQVEDRVRSKIRQVADTIEGPDPGRPGPHGVRGLLRSLILDEDRHGSLQAALSQCRNLAGDLQALIDEEESTQ